MLPDIVVPLDVNLVEDPLWWFEEVFLHLHGHVPGQQTHQQTLLHKCKFTSEIKNKTAQASLKNHID